MKIIVNAPDDNSMIYTLEDLNNNTVTGDILVGADKQHYIVCQMNTMNMNQYILFNIEDGLVFDSEHPDVFPLIKTKDGYQIILEQD